MARRRILKIAVILTAAIFFQIQCIGAETANATAWVTIKGKNFVADSMDGVDAVYTEEANAPDDPIYSCAAYVKKYYQKVYGVTVYNLMDDGPPLLSEQGRMLFLSPTPQKGDILFWPTRKGGNNHSAVVKAFDGEWITLIEQNYKTNAQAAVDRKIPFSDPTYEIWRLDTSGTSSPPLAGQSATQTGGSLSKDTKNKDEEEFSQLATAPREVEQTDTTSRQNGTGIEKEPETTDVFAYIPEGLVLPEEASQDDFWHDIEKSDAPDLIIGLPQGQASFHKAPDTLGESVYVAGLASSAKSEKPILEHDELQEAIPEAINKDLAGNAQAAELAAKSSFIDVPESHWAYDAIEKCVALGFFQGYEDGTFLPDKSITRSELAVIFTLAAKGKPIDGDTGFQDVGFLEWYNGYIGFAKRFIAGYTLEGHSFFAPLDPAERQDVCEAITLLLAVDLSAAELSVLDQFTDRDTIYKDREKAVAFCVSAGVITGFEDHTFQGSAPISRAQMAVILSRIF